MGNEQSQLNGGVGGAGGGRGELPWGFQVLKNTNENLAVEPWFDFIVGINGRQIVSDLFGSSFSETVVSINLWIPI